jgi:SNF2-related domain
MSTPPPKRQKLASSHPSTPDPDPTTPKLSKPLQNKRVIPDTPGTPPVQVAASSPLAADNTAAANRAMNLANPQYGVSPRRPGFPSLMVPQSPGNGFGGFVAQFQYVPGQQQQGMMQQQGHMAARQDMPTQQGIASQHGMFVRAQEMSQQAMASMQGQNILPQRSLQILPSGSAPVPMSAQYQIRPSLPTQNNISMASTYSSIPHPRPIQARPLQPHSTQTQPFAQQFPGGFHPNVPVQGNPVRRLLDMFPHVTDVQALNALTMCAGQFHDAALRISENPLFGVDPAPQQQQTGKRTLKAPHQTIQQRYTHLGQPQGFVPNTWPYNQLAQRELQPFPVVQNELSRFTVAREETRPTGKKRKLVRGSARFDSDATSISEEEESDVEVQHVDPAFTLRVLEFLNTSSEEDLSDTAVTPLDNVREFIIHRPFATLSQAKQVELPPAESEAKPSGRGSRRAKRGKNIGNRIVDGAEQVLAGYQGVDALISSCESIGRRVKDQLLKWGPPSDEPGALTLTSLGDTPSTQTTDPTPPPGDRPGSLAPDVSLKDYQVLGVNWLGLLYKEGLSCILADEMGLGKTCQVIAFLGGILERTGGQRGKHLVVVPSSTLGMRTVGMGG